MLHLDGVVNEREMVFSFCKLKRTRSESRQANLLSLLARLDSSPNSQKPLVQLIASRDSQRKQPRTAKPLHSSQHRCCPVSLDAENKQPGICCKSNHMGHGSLPHRGAKSPALFCTVRKSDAWRAVTKFLTRPTKMVKVLSA